MALCSRASGAWTSARWRSNSHSPIARASLIGVLLIVGMTVSGALAAWVLAAFVATGMLAYFARTECSAGQWHPQRSQGSQMLRFSLPVFFSNIVSSVGDNIQTIFLGALPR